MVHWWVQVAALGQGTCITVDWVRGVAVEVRQWSVAQLSQLLRADLSARAADCHTPPLMVRRRVCIVARVFVN